MPEHDALMPTLRPAARILLIHDAKNEEKSSSLLSGLNRSTLPIKRITEVSESFGHHIVVSPDYCTINDAIPECVIVDGAARDVNEQLNRLKAESFMKGVPILAMISPRFKEELLETLRVDGADDFISTEANSYEIQARIEGAVSLSRAREQIAYMRESMARQTRVDDLTGVMSRRFFFQQSHRECSRSRRYGHKLSCLMVEVDHFRQLSATFGEGAGETVLRSVATIIGQWTRDSDLVARFTEAKFVILLPETDIEGATAVREKIQVALGRHVWRHESKELPVTVSIGEAELNPGKQVMRVEGEFISEGDEVGETALSTRESLAGLLEDADAALYIARKGAKMPDVFVPYTPAPEFTNNKPVKFVKVWKPGGE
jgi:diguanylate cyclase (GGDEF)-like protein